MLAQAHFPSTEIGGNLFIVLIITVVFAYKFLIASMRHKQIMKAIEKGLPLSELSILKPRSRMWIAGIIFGSIIIIFGVMIIFSPLFPEDTFQVTWRTTTTPKQNESYVADANKASPKPVCIKHDLEKPTILVMFFPGLIVIGIGTVLLINGLYKRKIAISSSQNTKNISDSSP